jgi:uncharacterized membrane protein
MNSRSLAIALFASVAVNLFVIGAVVGGFVLAHRVHAMAPARPGMGPQPLWSAADTLPPARRQAYRLLLRDQAASVAQQVHQARQARRLAWEGLNAEPYDPAATAKNLSEARALEMQARGSIEQKIVEFAATLTPTERSELAEGLGRSAPGPRAVMMRRRMGRADPDGSPPPGP